MSGMSLLLLLNLISTKTLSIFFEINFLSFFKPRIVGPVQFLMAGGDNVIGIGKAGHWLSIITKSALVLTKNNENIRLYCQL